MKNKVAELVITITIALWVIYRLAEDAMNQVNSGWHTTVSTPGWQRVKLVGLVVVGMFFLWRIIKLISELSESRQ